MLMKKPEMSQRERGKRARKLLRMLEAHHPGEESHAIRLSVYAVATAHRLGVSDQELIHIKEAALLHDLGKLSVERSLLSKTENFTTEDRDAIEMHSILFFHGRVHKEFEAVGPMVRQHHERWDGTGYPDGLHGEEIVLGARILAVAEAFDIAAHGADWKKALSEADAIAEIKNAAGSQFDPAVVDAFLEIQPLIQPLI